jgi:hypothetical protein
MIKTLSKIVFLLLLSLQTLQSSFYYPKNNLINHLTHTQVGSEATIQATNGDIAIKAKKSFNNKGAQLSAKEDIDIDSNEVSVTTTLLEIIIPQEKQTTFCKV